MEGQQTTQITKFQHPKIKRIMQKNKEIGKIRKDVPMLISRAVHHFIKDLTQKCAEVSIKKGKTGHC